MQTPLSLPLRYCEKSVPEDAQCSETDFASNLTILGLLVFEIWSIVYSNFSAKQSFLVFVGFFVAFCTQIRFTKNQISHNANQWYLIINCLRGIQSKSIRDPGVEPFVGDVGSPAPNRGA